MDFKGFAARYVAERVWSPDQKIIDKGEDAIMLTFSATFRHELIAWVLSFGNEAKLVQPDWLVKEVKDVVKGMYDVYR